MARHPTTTPSSGRDCPLADDASLSSSASSFTTEEHEPLAANSASSSRSSSSSSSSSRRRKGGAASSWNRRKEIALAILTIAGCYGLYVALLPEQQERDEMGTVVKTKISAKKSGNILAAAGNRLGGLIAGPKNNSNSSSSDSTTTTTTARTSSQTTEPASSSSSSSGGEKKECTVWMAQSSIRGLQGYGIFTTRDLKAGESILRGPDGVGIPVEQTLYYDGPGGDLRQEWQRVWGNYLWGRGMPDHVAYEAPPDTMDFQTGLGCLPNHHCILSYLDTQYPRPPYDDTLVDRFVHPGAGAFTYHRGRDFTVDHDVAAGDEIFLNYGWCDRNKEGAPAWTANMYVTEDFTEAATLVDRLQQGKSGLHYDASPELLEQRVVPPETPALVQQLLPKTKQDYDELIKGTTDFKQIIEQVAQHSLDRRSPEWIKENGMCMENLRPQKSTLPQAGQGAFAQLFIGKGDMVVPAPLMQIVNKGALELYDYDTGALINSQLLLNYCFGHRNTTMLLCPNTNAVLLNHCSNRSSPAADVGGASSSSSSSSSCGPDGPNAAVRWSRGWDPTSDAWRNMTIQQIANQTGRGLAFEVYALRDIHPGQEVFIDYGVEWEQAFARHMSQWKAPPQQVHPWRSAKEANEQPGIDNDFITGNLRATVKHPYLFTGCQYRASKLDYIDAYGGNGGDKAANNNEQQGGNGVGGGATSNANIIDWRNMTDEQILGNFSDKGGARYGFRPGAAGYGKHHDRSYWPCSVLFRERTANSNRTVTSYTVRIHASPWSPDDLPWYRTGTPRILRNYPRSAIHYFVRPAASDQHLSGVFRHPIGIPDDMLPPQWNNNNVANHDDNDAA